MRDTKLEFGVGLFLLLGLACLVFLALRMGDIGLGNSGYYTLQARFTSTSGLKEGAFIELAGVRIGKVDKIILDNNEYESVVDLAIRDDVQLQDDSIASIRTAGIIGDRFVKISPGGSDIYLEDNEEILETEPSISLEELISKYIFESDE